MKIRRIFNKRAMATVMAVLLVLAMTLTLTSAAPPYWSGDHGETALAVWHPPIAAGLTIGDSSNLNMRVGGIHQIRLTTTGLEGFDCNGFFAYSTRVSYNVTPPGYVTVSPTGLIKCNRSGGLVIVVIKLDDAPHVTPVTLVITTQA